MIIKRKPSLADFREWVGQSGRLTLSIALLAAFVMFSFASRIHAIRCAMPYPQYIDEPYLTRIPANMLKTGDFNPHFFTYPALPSYVNAAAFTVGYLSAASHAQVKTTADIGVADYPYYDHPRIIWPAKLLYALLTIAATALMGLVSYRLYGNPALLFLAPLIASLSRLYFELCDYMNVNLYGLFFVALLYANLFSTLRHDDMARRAIWPGVWVGMAIASKYNLATLVLPPILAILFYGGARKLAKIAVLGVVAGATFLVCAPYTLLDFKSFLDDMGAIAYAYAKGSLGVEGDPGWGQFLYLLHAMVRDFGYPLFAAALLGGWALLRRCPRETTILLSFPAALFAQMSTLRVHALRNVIAAYPIYAAFCAVGLVVAAELIARALGRLRGWPRWAPQGAAVIVVAAALALLAPVQRAWAWAQTTPDTRNLAVEWVQAHIAKGSSIVIPNDLAMDARPLAEDYQLIKPTLRYDPNAMRNLPITEPLYIVMPVFGYDVRNPDGEALANRLNRLADYVEISQEFTGTLVWVNYTQPAPYANPALAIGQWRYPTSPDAPTTPIGDALAIEPAMLYGRKAMKAGIANLPWNSRLMSDRLAWAPGQYEIILTASGTPAKGQNALLRVYVGKERLVGEFYAAEDFQDETLTYTLTGPLQAPLIVDFVNDAATRDAAGKVIEDRNASIQAIRIRRAD